MKAELSLKPFAPKIVPSAAHFALGLLLLALVYRAFTFAIAGLGAIRYPWELDYGEGIVWQQMRWIFTDKAYGAIDQFPAIVFHYTPLYHVVTSIAAGGFGTDELATGRAVSLIATLMVAVASALSVWLLLEGRTSDATRRICSCAGGLLVFTYLPVIHWAPLMRVDMLALALTLFGFVAALKSVERPKLIHLGALLFVAAVYTKQTSIAAPVAVFSALLFLRPKLAIQGIATCIALGLAALFALSWLTDGGFHRHIFLYNVNRSDLSRLSWVAYAALANIACIAVALFVMARRFAELRGRLAGGLNMRRGLARSAADVRLLMAVAYFVFATLMLLLVAKSGSSINYFLEWYCATGLFAAMGLSEAQLARPNWNRILAVGIPIVLTIGVIAAEHPFNTDRQAPRARELARLSWEVSRADKPVISDDMVLLIRSGKDVQWEPAIFAELASTGVWDERPFVQRVRRGDFAAFITWKSRGHHRFDERYNPAVANAIDAAYPIKEETAGLVVHRPVNRP
jgi:hypothetical protein